MKIRSRSLRFLIPLFIMLILTGCAANPDGSAGSPAGEDKQDETFASQWFHISYNSDFGEIEFPVLNSERLDASENLRHFPVYRFDTRAEAEQFKARILERLSVLSGSSDGSVFCDRVSEYDDAFFEENSLVLVYVTASSGSHRFGIRDIASDETSFVIHIGRTDDPKANKTDDISGWFATIEVRDSTLDSRTRFDADLVWP